MTVDAAGNDVAQVGVPITGLIAYHPDVVESSIIADEAMGAMPFTLPEGTKKLGLVKVDGAPQETLEAGDALEFWQQGYKIAGDSMRSVTANLAENNENVNRLIDGKEPNGQGVVYVNSALPDALVVLTVVIQFRNGIQERYHGVARIASVEVDQSTRGEVRGKAVTFDWVEHELFSGSPYKLWRGSPTAELGD